MAKRTFAYSNFTPTQQASGGALTSTTYMGLLGGSSTQLTNVLEYYIAGMATSSAPTALCFARCSTIATTPTALAAPGTDAPMHPATAALAAPLTEFVAASTGPIRSAATTDTRIVLGLNAFGGIVRYNAAPGQEFSMLGNTASNGESVLSSENVGTAGLVNAHIMYETFVWLLAALPTGAVLLNYLPLT